MRETWEKRRCWWCRWWQNLETTCRIQLLVSTHWHALRQPGERLRVWRSLCSSCQVKRDGSNSQQLRHPSRSGSGQTVYSPSWTTQPSIPPGFVNEDQLRLGKQIKVWFIPFVDKCVGDRYNCVIPWQYVPYLSASVMTLPHKEALYQVSLVFTSTQLAVLAPYSLYMYISKCLQTQPTFSGFRVADISSRDSKTVPVDCFAVQARYSPN